MDIAALPGGSAAAINGIPGDRYIPTYYSRHTGALAYDVKAPKDTAARISFRGRTVVEGTPSPDKPASIKGVLNPTITVTHKDGTKSSKTITGEFFSLPDGAADEYDGTKTITRITKYEITGKEPIWTSASGIQLRQLPILGRRGTTGLCTHTTYFSLWGDGDGCNLNPFPQDVIINWSSFTAGQIEAGTPVTLVYQLRESAATYLNADIPLLNGDNHIVITDANGILQEAAVEVAAGPDLAMPWAQMAENAARLGGITSNNYALTSTDGLTLLNGWTAHGALYAIPKITKSGAIVTCSGLVTAGTVSPNTVLCVVPKGYRPQRMETCKIWTNDGFAHIQIWSNGSVVLLKGATTALWYSFNDITYLI